MEQGFEKADSANLPQVLMEMVSDYLISNANYFSAEIRNVKSKRSAKEEYGDNAVSYVQLKRELQHCTVQCRITPKHKVHKKAYTVIAIIDEANNIILSCECKDCVASSGGCKHAVAFLFWLYRRTIEPSSTSTECYWKGSNLSRVGRQDAYKTLKAISGKNRTSLGPKNENLVETLLNATGPQTGGIFDLYFECPLNNFDIFHLMLSYKRSVTSYSADNFLLFLKSRFELTKDFEIVTTATVLQSQSGDWYKMRFGRITASILYEAGRCKTVGGSLVEKIMGASKPVEPEPILRGKQLEPLVIKRVEKLKNIKIKSSGIILNKDYPIFGASPDGVSSEYAVEVKCPSKLKTIENYVKNNVINTKYYIQLQLNMLFLGKNKGLFCVASPSFEEDIIVSTYEISLNVEELEEIIDLSSYYWKTNIFNELVISSD